MDEEQQPQPVAEEAQQPVVFEIYDDLPEDEEGLVRKRSPENALLHLLILLKERGDTLRNRQDSAHDSKSGCTLSPSGCLPSLQRTSMSRRSSGDWRTR